MKLILAPLTILLILSIVGMAASLTGEGFGKIGMSPGDPANTIYYDYEGTPLITANYTILTSPVGEVVDANNDEWAYWNNGTTSYFGTVTEVYTMWWDSSHTQQLKYMDFGKSYPSIGVANINIGSVLGYVALIIGLMALVTVVGLRIVGSGVSDISVDAIFKGTAYLGIWGSLSVGAFALFGLLPLALGATFYLVLTIVFTLGVINSIGSPSGDA